jgi:hypothetical protein
MSKAPKPVSGPLAGEDFPEEEELRDGPMDAEILRMAIEALSRQGHAGISRESLRTVHEHRLLVADMLRDCRPLPVIREMIARLERGQV